MTLSAAMQEDDFLVEAASYAQYYEQAKALIQAVQERNLGEIPPQEIIDNPALFRNWLEQCRQAGHS